MESYMAPMGAYPHVMGVFAHPDDEVFCAGGVLAQFAAAGCPTMVLSATKGEAGQIHDVYKATRRTLGAVRERELRDACERLGIGHVECLDYRDGALSEEDEVALAEVISARIRAFRADIVITFGPDGGSGHPDHIAISNATTYACKRITAAGSFAPTLFYSAFPRQHRAITVELARWLAAQETAFQGSADFMKALALLTDEAIVMGYADDAMEVQWFPAGFSIVEQGEAASRLYLIVSGHADVIQDDGEGERRVRRLGPGQFFGAEDLARNRAYGASLVATDTTTCLSLSTVAATAFDGRGGDARITGVVPIADGKSASAAAGLTKVRVSACLDRKVAALAAHRTQFLADPEVFPMTLWEQLFGQEYFTQVTLSVGDSETLPEATYGALRRQLLGALSASA